MSPVDRDLVRPLPELIGVAAADLDFASERPSPNTKNDQEIAP